MSTEPEQQKPAFLPRLRIPKIPDEDTKGELLPRLRYPKFPDDPPQPEPQPPQSAVEWNPLCASEWRRIIEQNPNKAVQRALELAQRCDEAENDAKHGWSSRDEAVNDYEKLWTQNSVTKAQLAREQDNSRQSREEIEALKGEIAAAQSEAARLREAAENLLRKMADGPPWDGTTLGAEITELENELERELAAASAEGGDEMTKAEAFAKKIAELRAQRERQQERAKIRKLKRRTAILLRQPLIKIPPPKP